MRLLTLEDAFRFSRLLAVSGARDTVERALRAAVTTAAEKRERLLQLRRAMDEMDESDGAAKADLERRYQAAAADDTALYNLGINTVMEVLTLAAGQGVQACVYDFLAPALEVDTAVLAAMPLTELVQRVRELAEHNNLIGFFGSPSGISGGAKSGSTGDTQTRGG